MTRVLLAVHHQLDPDLGAPGATLQLGAALTRAGCTVDFYGFDQAFGGRTAYGVWSSVAFPWRLAAHLARRARDYDVVDATTGDAWLWGAAGRPGARAHHALITRSHGLESPEAARLKARARAGAVTLSWKYPLYHGGYRLWEVRQSLRVADRVLLLNDADRDYAVDRLGIDARSIAVLPNGIAPHFDALPEPGLNVERPLQLAFVGTWQERKGVDVLAAVLSHLSEAGVEYEATLLGTGRASEEVLASLSVGVRPSVAVVPGFRNVDLPRFLADTDILLAPSRFEGFGLALVEAMACGTAPVATPVGIAPTVVEDGRSGRLVPVGDALAMAAAVIQLNRSRDCLLAMRRAAQRTARAFGWDDIARRTLGVYASAVSPGEVHQRVAATPPAGRGIR